ncbi:hypothetical protein [Nonomuraea cavernae]|uniref:Uncharacterized protein n=1 Tax=Nonomuraea cavernae TaxID=2045107 RepID=A0A917YT54_9ACTN|nr:hypothetical protein [Nonomuraea cavernae]MCA2184325.1 hypothetical protein [Nonomuraea cavernae]GGO64144.1 hypothetical protein GCM10012289_12880 [Nonomuraea cavernae]
MSQPDETAPLADRRDPEEDHGEPEFADEFSPSPTDPANQSEGDPDEEVHGQAEGYDEPTEA